MLIYRFDSPKLATTEVAYAIALASVTWISAKANPVVHGGTPHELTSMRIEVVQLIFPHIDGSPALCVDESQ